MPKTKKFIYFLAFSIILSILFTYQVSKKSFDKKTEANVKTTIQTTNSNYVEYSKESFAKISTNRRVLFFYASWCPTCRPADASFRNNVARIPADLTIVRINYNDPETDEDEKELARKYAITYQHTYVQIDNNGSEITKWNGGQLEELLGKIK